MSFVDQHLAEARQIIDGLDREAIERMADVLARARRDPEVLLVAADAQLMAGFNRHAWELAELAEGVAKRVLSAELRLSIRQVALHRDETPEPAPSE